MGVFSGFQFSFGKDPPVGWTEIALADFKYMSSNQLYNSLQINIVSKLGPLEIRQLLRFAQLQGTALGFKLPIFGLNLGPSRSAKEQKPSKNWRFRLG